MASSGENERMLSHGIGIDLKCKRCGRGYPETILNLEGAIHHGSPRYLCLDTKSCNRIVRKRKFKLKRKKS